MKYPVEQFTVLCEAIKAINSKVDITALHPSNIHYLVYQQYSEGQLHNRLVMCDGTVKRAHSCEGLEFTPIIENEYNFELYPAGCNDSHIETAVNKAFKTLAASAN